MANMQFWETKVNNLASFSTYYNRLTEIAISRFKYKNIPKTVDLRFYELAEFVDGFALGFVDPVLGMLVLRSTIQGEWNVYNIPKHRRAYASNNYNAERNDSDSVIIFNNMLRTNTQTSIIYYARKLAEYDRVIDVNIKAQKTPILITCPENQRLTLKNVYSKYEGNEPVIYAQKELTKNDISAISTGAPYVADRIYELKTKVWNEALTFLGVSNIAENKKERMITDEVERQLGGTLVARNSYLKERQTAWDKLYEMFPEYFEGKPEVSYDDGVEEFGEMPGDEVSADE